MVMERVSSSTLMFPPSPEILLAEISMINPMGVLLKRGTAYSSPKADNPRKYNFPSKHENWYS
jgi:hypothetical protein